MEEGEVEMSSTHSDRISFLEEGTGAAENDEEEDEIYYIPERRPSLDLAPMDTSHWQTVERAASPVLSYSSMGSDSGHQSVGMDDKDRSSTSVRLERTDSFSSCYSYDSDDCEKRTRKVGTKDDTISLPPARPELIKDPNVVKHPSLTVGFTFKVVCEILKKLTETELTYFRETLWNRYPESWSISPQHLDMIDLVDKLLECYDVEVTIQLTKYILKLLGKKKLVEHLEERILRNEVRFALRNTLKQNYASVKEPLEQVQKPFHSVYSPVHMTLSHNHGPCYEHEIRKIARIEKNTHPEKPMDQSMIFRMDMIEEHNVNFLVTIGAPGSGKSMSVQKFILDWAEERSHDHINFVFPLPFKDLYKIPDEKISFLDLLYRFYPEARRLKALNSIDGEGKFLFIFDGFDEYPVECAFGRVYTVDCTNVCPVSQIVVNLLRGSMYRNNLVWVTTRPLKNCDLPSPSVFSKTTEIQGFNDDLKDVYFRKMFDDPAQAEKVINHVKSLKTMHIMCHLPVFCALLRTEFQREFDKHGPHAELPRTLTKVYTRLLLRNLDGRSTRAKPRTPEEELDFLMKMGKLAFGMVEKGEWEVDTQFWDDSGITYEEAVEASGLCTEFDNGRYIFSVERSQTFVPFSMQEYMAALYAFLSFSNHGKNVLLTTALKDKISRMFKPGSWLDLYKCAVERSLLCEDGRDDLFLRFLMGMAVKTNQELLKHLMTSSEKTSLVEDIAKFIKKKLNKGDLNPDRMANLHHCLDELGVGTKQASTL